MHEVGRDYGQAHHLTLATLQRYVLRSNNLNCSAGFGMGLVMYPAADHRSGGASAAQTCADADDTARTHACTVSVTLMRAYHGRLREAVAACRRCGPCTRRTARRERFTITGSVRARTDGAVAWGEPSRGSTGGRFTYIRPCWYRYFLEKPLMVPIRTPGDLVALCRGLRGMQRFGCVSAAALTVSSSPFDQMRLCAGLRGRDGAACVRGVPDQALAGQPSQQLRLIRACSRMSAGVRRGCYEWLGRTLAVVTNGSFRDQWLRRVAARCGAPVTGRGR